MHTLMLGLLISVAAAPAFAQTDAPVEDSSRRFAFGLQAGIFSSAVALHARGENTGGFGLGFSARGGHRLTDFIVLDGELSGGTALFMGYCRLAFTAGVTPFDWLGISTGPVVGANYVSFLGSASNTYVGGTVRVDFNISRVTLGLAGDLGVTLTGRQAGSMPGMSGGAFLTIGYTLDAAKARGGRHQG